MSLINIVRRKNISNNNTFAFNRVNEGFVCRYLPISIPPKSPTEHCKTLNFSSSLFEKDTHLRHIQFLQVAVSFKTVENRNKLFIHIAFKFDLPCVSIMRLEIKNECYLH